MSSQKMPITAHGYARIEKELRRYKTVERPKVIGQIAEARAHGDISENAEYDAAKEHQGFIEARIRELENAVALAEIVDTSKIKLDIAAFGATVVVEDPDSGAELTYRIVGDLESSPEQGLIAVSSPVARALLGRREGDEVTVQLPDGTKHLEIMEIRYEEIQFV